MYRIVNNKTHGTWAEFHLRIEALECFEWGEVSENEYNIIYVTQCKNCGRDADERYDFYGISTGHWCEECYESKEYPYRKDRYATIEHDGYGERLDNNF